MNNVPEIAEQLHQYATAIADPTRGMLLVEIDRAGEATATQLARRLGLTANNVYHHMRILLRLGLVDPPRIVPGPTYVEKYFRINPQIRAALRLDPGWYDRVGATITPEDRQAVLVSVCLTMAHLLRQAAHEYAELDPETLDRHMKNGNLILQSINRISREQLELRLPVLREALEKFDEHAAEDVASRTDLMIIAALPALQKGANEPQE